MGCGVGLFVSIGDLFISNVVIMFDFFEKQDLSFVYGLVLLILVVAFVGCGCKRWFCFFLEFNIGPLG